MSTRQNVAGKLLLDPGGGTPKLNSEQRSLWKATAKLLPPSASDQTLNMVGNLILVLGYTTHTPRAVNSLYRYYQFLDASLKGHLLTPRPVYKQRYSTMPPEISLVGMDNWKTVLCYIDSMLVAMFYSSGSFDFMLDMTVDDNSTPELQRQIEQLKVVLRFIVNIMRSGEFIPAGVMQQLCIVLDSLGCELALSGTQEDSLDFFEFLTESLSLPLLTIKLDIIHSGRMNLSDDLRLIQERVILISVPPPPNTTGKDMYIDKEPSITLEECLNNYFNNSVTVRRHIDQKRARSPSLSQPTKPSDNDIDAYERMGIVQPFRDIDSSLEDPINEDGKQGVAGSALNVPSTISKSSSASSSTDVAEEITPTHTTLIPPASPIGEGTSSGTTNNSTELSSALSTPSVTDSAATDCVSQVGSISKVSERIEASRTRSSTIVSVLNNVPVSDPMKLTRRASSISNAEVALPAWMFLQLLPYYTDPSVDLKFENHEELYRSRNSRSKTIDSVDATALAHLAETTKFEQRFGNKRPIVPICLKRYTFDNKGVSHKIRREVVIPEVLRYPYFIAEDRTKPGFVDFRRGFDNRAPCGSFMLVLESAVCHRGSSVNSGHYITLTRKRPFEKDEDVDSNAKDWVLFNDMLAKGEKSKDVSFNEAMETETPYVLFYRIVEMEKRKSISPTMENDELAIKTGKGYSKKYWSTPSTMVTSAIIDSDDEDHGFTTAHEHSLGNSNHSRPSVATTEESGTRTLRSSQNSMSVQSGKSVQSEASAVTAASSLIRLPSSVEEDPSKDSSSSSIRKGFSKFSRSNSKQTKESSFVPLMDIGPTETFYLDVDHLYYWYDYVQQEGYVDGGEMSMLPTVMTLSQEQIETAMAHEEAADPGFMEKLNGAFFKRATSTSSPHKHHRTRSQKSKTSATGAAVSATGATGDALELPGTTSIGSFSEDQDSTLQKVDSRNLSSVSSNSPAASSIGDPFANDVGGPKSLKAISPPVSATLSAATTSELSSKVSKETELKSVTPSEAVSKISSARSNHTARSNVSKLSNVSTQTTDSKKHHTHKKGKKFKRMLKKMLP